MNLRHTTLLLLALAVAAPLAWADDSSTPALDADNLLYSAELMQKAEAGNPAAQCVIGHCLAHGKGVAANEAEAAKWLAKAADQGFDWAQYDLARLARKGCPEAQAALGELAGRDVAWAQYELGRNHANGWGVAKSEKDALGWYLKAARHGNIKAKGEILMRAESGNPHALGALRALAEAGDVPAQYSLAQCHLLGWGVKKDESSAVKWLKAAAEGGSTSAKFTLWKLAQKGNGEAWEVLEGLADAGDEGLRKALQEARAKRGE